MKLGGNSKILFEGPEKCRETAWKLGGNSKIHFLPRKVHRNGRETWGKLKKCTDVKKN